MASGKMSTQRYFITGGAGFIGSHLVRRLLQAGHQVAVFTRSESSLWRLNDVAASITEYHGDLTDYPSLERCVASARPDVVIHLGGGSMGRPWNTDLSELQASMDVNINGTFNLLKATANSGRPIQRFIRMGGLLEYGDGPQPFKETQREQPASIYPAIQVATTMILNALHRNFDFPVVTLRLASVFGPGRSLDFFIPALITHALEGKSFDMSSGEQMWDMIYIDDVVDAILKAVSADLASGEIINIGTGRGYPLKSIAQKIVQLIGGNAKVNVGALADADKSGVIANLVCNIDKAERLLGWRPSTSLEDGLIATINWYHDNLELIRRQMKNE